MKFFMGEIFHVLRETSIAETSYLTIQGVSFDVNSEGIKRSASAPKPSGKVSRETSPSFRETSPISTRRRDATQHLLERIGQLVLG
ncbi:MAG TPA: hypothetical protein VNU00_03065, partial [Candidatus Binataceae bacterium]|nr:hypothetical protein [Candidatus Binataceae bacterium]